MKKARAFISKWVAEKKKRRVGGEWKKRQSVKRLARSARDEERERGVRFGVT